MRIFSTTDFSGLNFAGARVLQEKLRHKVITHDVFGDIRYIAGLDVGLEGEVARGAAIVLSYPNLELVESAIARAPIQFPYVPGYLSFREVPVLVKALESLAITPNLILCDGQGIAHPRRFGLACHVGIVTDIPSIGVGKTRLIGIHQEPGTDKGSWSKLTHQGETIGAVVRTRANTKPVYVSTGHKISLESAIKWTLKCCPKYRLPETTRSAHKLASE